MVKKNQPWPESQGDKIFLGKNSKIYGPFSKAEFDQMFAAGKLSEYFWIWDLSHESWKPIEMPPAPPPIAGRIVKSGFDWKKVKVLCFDHFTLASGTVEQVTESGCELISEDGEGGAKFSSDATVVLSLYDALSNKATSVRVQVARIDFRNHFWVYRLKWDGIPLF